MNKWLFTTSVDYEQECYGYGLSIQLRTTNVGYELSDYGYELRMSCYGYGLWIWYELRIDVTNMSATATDYDRIAMATDYEFGYLRTLNGDYENEFYG